MPILSKVVSWLFSSPKRIITSILIIVSILALLSLASKINYYLSLPQKYEILEKENKEYKDKIDNLLEYNEALSDNIDKQNKVYGDLLGKYNEIFQDYIDKDDKTNKIYESSESAKLWGDTPIDPDIYKNMKSMGY